MASTSALRLDVCLAAAYHTSPLASASSSARRFHPRIPPRSEWPLDTGSTGDDDDGWGVQRHEGNSSEWITASSSWREGGEVDGNLSGREAHHRDAYLALGMADGTTWIFSEEAGDGGANTGAASAAAGSQNEILAAASMPSHAHRPPSPTSSTHSHASRTPTSQGHTHPPFAGFSHHSEASSILSPTHTTYGLSNDTSSSDGWTASESKEDATGSHGPSSTSASMDALESRLEAQYHSGSNKESGISQVMETLGLSRHSHSGSHHHHPAPSSPARTRKGSSKTSPAASVGTASPALTPGSRPPSPEVSRGNSSNLGAPVGRRHAHSRSSALTTGLPASFPGSVTAGSGVEGRTRAISGVSNRSSIYGGTSTATLVAEDEDAKAAPLVRPTQDLRSLRPLIRITSADRSAITSVRSVEQGESRLLLVLHCSGMLLVWSLKDSRLLSSTYLASSKSYLAATGPAPLAPATNQTTGLTGGLPGPLANIAALRSISSSPAPGKGGFASRPASRPASRGPGGPSSPAVAAAPTFGEVPCSHHGHFQDLVVRRDQDGNVLAACYDSVKKRVVFIELAGHRVSDSACSTVVGTVDTPEATGRPSLVLSKSPLSAQVAHQTQDGTRVVFHDVTFAGPKKRVVTAPQQTLVLPVPEDESLRSLSLVWDNILLIAFSQQVAVLKRQEDQLVPLASITLSGVESISLLPELGSGTSRWATITCHGSSQLLEIISNSTHAEVVLASTVLDKSAGAALLSALPRDDPSDNTPDVLHGQINQSKQLTIARSGTGPEPQTLYESTQDDDRSVAQLLPLSMERIVTVSPAGHLVSVPLSQLLSDTPLAEPSTHNSPQTKAALTLFTTISHSRAQSRIIVGGYESGDIAFWDSSTLALLAQWSLFTTPIVNFCQFGKEDNTLRLHGCVAIAAQDGTVAIILLDGFKLLHLIPGRGVPLERIAVRADEILLLYGDERARVWDMATMELRRSVGVEQALSLLEDGAGAWSQHLFMGNDGLTGSSSTGVLSASVNERGGQPTLTADLGRAIEAAAKAVRASAGADTSTTGAKRANTSDGETAPAALRPQPTRPGTTVAAGGKRALSILRPLLAALWPRHRDARMDDIVDGVLGGLLKSSRPAFFGLPRERQAHILFSSDQSLSAPVETFRTLAVLAMLEVLAQDEDIGEKCKELADWISESATGLSLSLLALHLGDPTSEVGIAANRLFNDHVSGMSGDEIEKLCGDWRAVLPTKQIPSSAVAPSPGAAVPPTGTASATSLALLGFIGVSCYKSLDPALLKDIATSILTSLSLESPATLQNLALELCLAGFSTWQPYLDAMDLLRKVFRLAMSNVGETGSASSGTTAPPQAPSTSTAIRNLARRTTLHIAEENTPLFMTTLHLDILQAATAAQANATMHLVAYIIRRRPLVLYANLPRLTEAVVKSLDPTSPLRESVLSSATLMISELIGAYPCIAFHNRLQRLAIGTHEGAVVLYDLKTATRLFILEGHQRRVDAVSFSPSDGRRLISVSLGEGKALGWKVGSSLAGFFAPGVMPKQGGGEGTSGAYKAVHFEAQRRRGGAGGGAAATAARDVGGQKRGEKTGGGEKHDANELEELPRVSFDWKNDRVGIFEIAGEPTTRIPFDVS